MILKPFFEVAIPDTFTSNYTSFLQRSIAIGFLARALSIFRVRKVYIYREKPNKPKLREARQIKKILEYLETPQYLRKKLFKMSEDLKFVGLLPPLRTPHHKMRQSMDEVKIGDIREGVVVKSSKGGAEVYVGLERNVVVRKKLPIGKRVTVMVKAKNHDKILGELINKSQISEYWGFEVDIVDYGIIDLLNEKVRHLKILTSRKGVSINLKVNELKEDFRKHNYALIVFGGPYRGLFEIISPEKIHEIKAYILNMIPHQGTETVRVEEAVYISLGILNLIRTTEL